MLEIRKTKACCHLNEAACKMLSLGYLLSLGRGLGGDTTIEGRDAPSLVADQV